jgi:hypothetical protein
MISAGTKMPSPATRRPLKGKSHATFDVAGAGNVTIAAGLKATAKAVEHPPEPKSWRASTRPYRLM